MCKVGTTPDLYETIANLYEKRQSCKGGGLRFLTLTVKSHQNFWDACPNANRHLQNLVLYGLSFTIVSMCQPH